MNKKILFSVVIIGSAVIIQSSRQKETTQQLDTITATALQNADGKDGRNCWLAVDGVVYEIEQGYKWNDGEHTESSSAYCGADMSAVIDSAPHGRTKLSQLKKVGTLEK